MNEIIKAEINSTEALNQLSPQCIIEYLSREYADRHKELLGAFHDKELIEYLGGVGQILEDNPCAVQEHVGNIHKSHEEDKRDLYREAV